MPLISPGLIQVHKGFNVGLQTEGVIFEGAYKRHKKKTFET